MSATYNNRLIAHPTSRLGKKQKNDNQLGGESRNTTSTESLLDVPETIEETNIRKNALRTLENYEELVWTAMARNESVSQTRLHFEALLAGLPSADPYNVEWPTEYQDERSKRGNAEGRSSGGGKDKGKARLVVERVRTSLGGEESSSSSKDKERRKKKDKERDRGRRSLGDA
ncbi:hypothetical protein BDV97DRAFT_401950 [Delphinella strobiligena]|nr:hypothetical protein BDV97DRAFT_401950 [Delphinella strobiligena]